MFIFRIKNKFDNWIVPKRISDNSTKIEREGMEEVKKDKDHIYKMEDKGSCIVRLEKVDYENNVKTNLSKGNQYEQLASDPTKETVDKVVDYVNNLQLNDEIKDTTAEVIVAKTSDTKPGAYTEQPKTQDTTHVLQKLHSRN